MYSCIFGYNADITINVEGVMLNLLAQTYDYTYETTQLSAGESAGMALFSGVFLLVWLAVAVVSIIAMWKMFEKAGVEGWKAIIPIYNYWTLCEIAGRPGWWSLVVLLAWIPFLGYLAVLAVNIIVSIDLAKSFGKEPVWAILFFVSIGYLIVAFDKNTKYVGPGGKGGAPKAA